MWNRMVACVAMGACLAAPSRVRAQWTSDPGANTPVAIAPGRQSFPIGAPDGQGGAFFVWTDARDSLTSGVDMWAQHLSAGGVRLWGDGGVPVAIIADNQLSTSLLPAGDGGLYVAWNTDQTFPPPRVQRLDPEGAQLWGNSGILVTGMTGQHINPKLLAMPSGDVLVTWSTAENMSVMAQVLSPDGQRLWGDDGLAVCTSLIPQQQSVVPDGAGGAIIGWQDYRDPYGNVYAQRLDASGVPQWISNGARVAPTANEQALLACSADGAGGMVLAWIDIRSGVWRVFAQRVGPDGTPLWAPTGVEASTNPAQQISPRLASSGAGEALACWTDSRSGQDALYVQRWSASGARLWGDAGVPVGAVAATQGLGTYTSPASDELGGLIVGWPEARTGVYSDIYAQRVLATGVRAWGENGVAVSSAAGTQTACGTLPDGAGGAIIFWRDRRSDAGDIYAQHVRADGSLGGTVGVEPVARASAFSLTLTGMQPCRAEAAMRLELPADGSVDLVVHDVQGRRLRSLVHGTVAAGIRPIRWDLRDEDGSRVAPGVYLASASWQGRRTGARIVVLR